MIIKEDIAAILSGDFPQSAITFAFNWELDSILGVDFWVDEINAIHNGENLSEKAIIELERMIGEAQ